MGFEFVPVNSAADPAALRIAAGQGGQIPVITERAVGMTGSPMWAWAVLVALGLVILLLLGVAIVAIAFSRSKVGTGFRRVWIAGAVGLVAAGLLAYEGTKQLTHVGTILVDASGKWTLLSPVGWKLGEIPATADRSLLLWAESSSREYGAASDSMDGVIRLATGGEYHLANSQRFDLLARLGYGAYWLEHPNLSLWEEKEAAQQRDRLIFMGEGRHAGLALPAHSYQPDGIRLVQRHLDENAGRHQ